MAVGYAYMPSVRDIDELPKMVPDDFTDTCNKLVPLYICVRTSDRIMRGLVPIVLHNFLYRRWFRPYRSDIKGSRFFFFASLSHPRIWQKRMGMPLQRNRHLTLPLF